MVATGASADKQTVRDDQGDAAGDSFSYCDVLVATADLKGKKKLVHGIKLASVGRRPEQD